MIDFMVSLATIYCVAYAKRTKVASRSPSFSYMHLLISHFVVASRCDDCVWCDACDLDVLYNCRNRI